jgi:hypothetical protein
MEGRRGKRGGREDEVREGRGKGECGKRGRRVGKGRERKR